MPVGALLRKRPYGTGLFSLYRSFLSLVLSPSGPRAPAYGLRADFKSRTILSKKKQR